MTPPNERPVPDALERAGPEPLLLDEGAHDGPRGVRAALGAASAAGAGVLAWLLLASPERAPLLPALVEGHLGESGVTNPVTAVLLNFRAFDTLLEVAVLAVAMTAVWSLDRGERRFGRDPGEEEAEPVLLGLTRIVVPIAGVTAVYLAWMGAKGTGGAFQAGALLAGAGVLLTVSGLVRPPTAGSRLVRGAVAAGLVVFIGVGFVVLPVSGAFLAYPEGWAYPLIVGVEAVLTVTIAVVLVELFVDVPAVPDPDPALSRLDPTGDPLGRALDLEGGVVAGKGDDA